MRHRLSGRQLNRTRNQRQALFRSQLRSLFTHGYIVTTLAKAKSIENLARKIAKLSLIGDLNSIRAINQIFDSRSFVASLVSKMKLTFANVKGDLIKLEKVGYRQGDNAQTVKLSLILAFVSPKPTPTPAEKKPSVTKNKKEK